jgi:hypothetical protein
MVDLISQPWHWAISGIMIASVMIILLRFGGELATLISLIFPQRLCNDT